MFNPESYFEHLYTANQPELGFAAQSKEAWRDWRSRLLQAVSQVLGEFPEPAEALSPRMVEEVEFPSYTRQKVVYTIAKNFEMPAYVLIPKNQSERHPAVIALHGHGFGCKDIVGMQPDGSENKETPGYQKWFGLELVKQGFVVIAPELLGFGELRLPEDQNDSDPNRSSCHRMSTRLLLYGQTMGGLRTYQVLRTIDYLAERKEIDPERIGCMGISGGGMICMLAAALDERIKAAVISGYMNTFKDSIMSVHHCVDNFIPGLLKYAEMPDIAGLIAPRPLLLESADKDDIFPHEASWHAYRQLKNIYHIAGAEENLDIDAFAGVHEISGAKAYPWLQKII